MSAAPAEPFEVDDLDAAGVLDAISEADRAERRAAAEKLALAYHWAVLHPATEQSGVATPGGPALDVLFTPESLGGEGTPAVAAFAPEPLAVRLGITPTSAAALIGDAQDLVHRHPLLWRKVKRLRVPAWQARRVVQQTRRLPLSGARWVDEQLARRSDGACGPVIVDRLVAQLTATADPETQQEAEEAAQAGWDVTISRADPTMFAGSSHLDVDGDTATLQELHDVVAAIAHQLWLDGDKSPLGVRKIKALRLIVRGAVGRSDSERTDKIRFFVHVDAHDLEPQPPGEDVYAVGRIEKLGAATMARLRQWVGHHQVTFVPVLNMQRGDAVDVHDPPAWMRELVILRDGHCVFPGCTRDARSCDLDHITPYVPDGPPGQTRPDNLACLCRRHHRAKTAGLWRYSRTLEGEYRWRGPYGTTYLVTPRGTHRLC
jgi:hypothetical protein